MNQSGRKGVKILLARRVCGLVFTGWFSMACAAQQATATGASPSGSAAKPLQGSDTKPAITHTAEDGRRALREAEAAHPGNTPEVAEALVELVYDDLFSAIVTDDTLATAERAMQVSASALGKESHQYAIAVAAKASVLEAMDRPELARPLAEEALGIEQKIGSDPEGLADVANILASICQRSGDKVCALQMGELQVKSLRSMKDADQLRLAKALTDLMYARRMIPDMVGAKVAADEISAIAARSETAIQDWLPIETTVGGFYMVNGDFQRSLEHLKRGLDLNIQLNGVGSLTQSGVTANLAYVEMCLGHTPEALNYYARARDLFARRYGPQFSQTLRVETGYGYAMSALGRYKEAIDLVVSAHKLQREHIRLAIRLMPEQQALAMANTSAESFNIAMSLVIHHPDTSTAEVYQEVVRSRALVAEEMAKRQATLIRKLDPAVEGLEQELGKQEKALMELQGTPAAGKEAALTDATEKMNQAERQLAERSAAFRADERAESSYLADLRKNMPSGSVLISYVSFAKYAEDAANFNKMPVLTYMAFVLRRNSEQIGVYDLGDAKTIVALVKRMRASVEAESDGGGAGSKRNEREYREAGLELRKLIWDPLSKDLQNANLALVTPDGILNLVPFSALPQDNGYLVEHGPVVHILSSERDLIPAARGEKKTGLLAVGGPSFELAKLDVPASPGKLRDGPIDCDAFTKMEFPALPGSLDEVKDISSTFKRWNGKETEQLLTGEDATRSRFLDAATQSRVLHIATHAFVLDRSCGNGNPLMHSGLVFAGANKSRNSSILTAQQIASLDLSGVDWAVLSACDTGNGELKDGEGVLGLERAFRVAGAKSVVMALWPVDDEVTREFMRGLYAERFGQHATTANAVWNASRTLLKAREAEGKSTHPWYWAGFVGAGGWE